MTLFERLFYAGVLVVIGALVWIALHAPAWAEGSYWYKAAAPVQVLGIVFVERPCGKRIDGCAHRSTGLIELRTGMDTVLRTCVESHERRHLERGEDHPVDRPHFAIDCGDGTILSRQAW